MNDFTQMKKAWQKPVIFNLHQGHIESGGGPGAPERVQFSANTCGKPYTIGPGLTGSFPVMLCQPTCYDVKVYLNDAGANSLNAFGTCS